MSRLRRSIMAGLLAEAVKGERTTSFRSLDAILRKWLAKVQNYSSDHLFNYFKYHGSHSSLLRELGDPATLKAIERVYTTHARSISTSYCVLGGERFATLSPLTQECPRELRPGRMEQVELHVGEELSKRTRRGAPSLLLKLHALGLAHADDLAVTINGRQLRNGKKTGEWLEFHPTPTCFRRGLNQFAFTLKPGRRSRPILDDLLLWVNSNEAQ